MVRAVDDIQWHGKRVLVREDFNVPVKQGVVTSMARIDAGLPTLRYLLDAGAQVAVMSHLGRPVEGVCEPEFSLAPVATALSERLGISVPLVRDWIDGFAQTTPLVLLENVRYLVGEGDDDPGLAQRMASLCDVYVMDAFGTAHRAHASTHGVGRYAPEVCAGPLMAAELDALGKALAAPARPAVAIVGGSKVSTKLDVLHELARRVDQIIVGGGIANTFLAAAGYSVGRSLMEADLVETARSLMKTVDIPLPVDLVVARDFSADAPVVIRARHEVADDEMILDVGPKTQASYAPIMHAAKTVLWNGPVGVFEFPSCAAGTRALAHAIARSEAFSLAGGGDTLAAIEQFGVTDQISYISTGGGAFLEFVEGKDLPAVVMLQARSNA
ncbi:MAG: phosphoglycerate kinase [Litorivicinaceae bacterium]|jgi:phosphoglycerate kinase|nr:phosphoglycerate kinase [Litorivicinaceae bacterium]MDP5329011.1 phosphoglycerate kinase [Litorivicinaceae bacterium]MDP5330787.1 phosphoglycerate kinase [Litorivicinaceae bacterium]MDP5342310.1 phosphoglycerate kinase [Litorivicinaceae bacterium]MDP5343647.1 phosphoglycerate kinase [Litorivicinaceae bacterium]